jgi:hypothetical protein
MQQTHSSSHELKVIRKKMARSMVGRTVDLLADARTIAHGVVSGVLVVDGIPKLVVDGMRYNLNQILTVSPQRLNPGLRLQ